MAASKTKKGRKFGRRKDTCARYRAEGRKEKNKKRRVARHVRGNPNDIAAAAVLDGMRV